MTAPEQIRNRNKDKGLPKKSKGPGAQQNKKGKEPGKDYIMLKTNCKQALENIRNYVYEYALDRYEEEHEEAPERSAVLANVIDVFHDEYYRGAVRKYNEQRMFEEWARGLSMNGLFCYYYNREALDDLGSILEETEEEKSRYTEERAAQLLTYLIYRECRKAYDKKRAA